MACDTRLPLAIAIQSPTESLGLLRLVALVLPLVIFLLWWLGRLFRRRRMLLQKQPSSQQPRLEQLICIFQVTGILMGSVRGAVSYTIEVTCNNSFALRRCGGPSLTRSGITQTSYVLDRIAAQKSTLTIPVSFSSNASIYGTVESYSWRVWAVDAKGNEGSRSGWWSFER